MDTKRTIRKILFVAMWLVIGAGMLSLLIAAMGRQRKDLCKDYSITVSKVKGEDLFLSEAAILKLLKAAANGNIKGQSKSSFNLQKMEQLLEDNVWIKDAQLYFDNKNVLHVSVAERVPVARIFTSGGRSFYVDENKMMLPLSEKVSARVPVFTGFPDKKNLGSRDSMLLTEVASTARFIAGDPFWMAQVSQIDLVSCGSGCWDFEMVPMVGNHIVKLGDGTEMEKKFDRLLVFYRQVLSKTGFNKYKTIDVQYEGQVVAAKSTNPKVDSIQFRKNVEQMMREAREIQHADETTDVQTTATHEGIAVETGKDSRHEAQTALVAARQETIGKKTEENKRPRAVMPKRVKGSNN